MPEPTLQLHLEPAESIEVLELTNLLGSLSRQYQEFAQSEGVARTSEPRLLVSSVSPGSIDISFVPDGVTVAGVTATIVPLVVAEKLEVITKFAGHIKTLLDFFSGPTLPEAASEITVKDCDDATNIVKPIAEHGGSQTFNVFNGDTVINVLTTDLPKARAILEKSARVREELQFPAAEVREGVSLVWKQLARDEAKTTGKYSPDKGIISDIDNKPHAVLFTDEMSYLKREMIDDEQNPYQYVYFVDVVVSRVTGKISAYRIAGYHGKEDLPE